MHVKSIKVIKQKKKIEFTIETKKLVYFTLCGADFLKFMPDTVQRFINFKSQQIIPFQDRTNGPTDYLKRNISTDQQ